MEQIGRMVEKTGSEEFRQGVIVVPVDPC